MFQISVLFFYLFLFRSLIRFSAFLWVRIAILWVFFDVYSKKVFQPSPWVFNSFLFSLCAPPLLFSIPLFQLSAIAIVILLSIRLIPLSGICVLKMTMMHLGRAHLICQSFGPPVVFVRRSRPSVASVQKLFCSRASLTKPQPHTIFNQRISSSFRSS